MKKLQLLALAAMISASAAILPADEHKGACDENGFVSIFNGKNLDGWDGDPQFWSVEDGAIVGQTTRDKKAKSNTFCVWRDGKVEDFILKVKFRIRNGNSGIQYRSKESKKWRVSGYQAEIDNQLGDVGEMYDEGGRGHTVPRVGEFVVINKQGKRESTCPAADVKQLKKDEYYKPKQWNDYTIIARGNHIVQKVNGHITCELIDNDPRAAREGIVAFQIHRGAPMKVEFKDIRLKRLEADYDGAFRLFNGKDLSGWTFSDKRLEDTWSAKDCVLVNAGKPAGYIRTKEDYTNYVLRLQFRHFTKGNSGVLLRVQMPDKVWPKAIEAQGMYNNVGDIWNIDKFPMKTDPDRTKGRRTVKLHKSNEKPIGQWNQYEILLNGGELKIYVNGLLQNKAADCEEIPGKIAIQSEGANMEYRNIVLIPIGKAKDK